MSLTKARRNQRTRPTVRALSAAVTLCTAASLASASLAAQSTTARAAAAKPAPPAANYWVYVGAESKDEVYRIRFGPDGAVVERTIYVGELPAEMEGPHGLQITPDGKYLHMTTGHGFPDGKY